MHNALLDYGIVEPQEAPFNLTSTETDSDADTSDNFLDPNTVIPSDFPANIQDLGVDTQPNIVEQSTTSFTGPLSLMTDKELNDTILHLRSHYRQAGISMLDGMLRCLGH